MRLESVASFLAALFVVTLNGCQGHSPLAGLLSPGARPPDLSGTDQRGQIHNLGESRGHFTVVYFYPKDDTPGCTKEACAFRDVWNQYRDAQVQLYGVSVDDQVSHASFAGKYALPFPIIADQEAQWVRAFGVDPGTHAALVLADVRNQIH